MENPIKHGMIWGSTYFWKHPYVHAFGLCFVKKGIVSLDDATGNIHNVQSILPTGKGGVLLFYSPVGGVSFSLPMGWGSKFQ